jgi:hypothetical protein
MLKVSMFLSVALVSASALAHGAPKAGAVYYVGQQQVGLVDQAECYVEAVYSPKGSKATVRALVSDPHGDGDLIGLGEVLGKYSSSKVGYYFSTTKKDAPIKEMLLSAVQKKQGTELALTVAHEDHYDGLKCETLVGATDQKLEDIEEMFEHFEDYVEEDGHDHDHDHQH